MRFEESEQSRARNRDSCEVKDQGRVDQSPTCGACTLFKDSITDVSAKSNVPLLTSACSNKTYKMPVTEGKLGKFTVTVLRDTGCSGVVVGMV